MFGSIQLLDKLSVTHHNKADSPETRSESWIVGNINSHSVFFMREPYGKHLMRLLSDSGTQEIDSLPHSFPASTPPTPTLPALCFHHELQGLVTPEAKE